MFFWPTLPLQQCTRRKRLVVHLIASWHRHRLTTRCPVRSLRSKSLKMISSFVVSTSIATPIIAANVSIDQERHLSWPCLPPSYRKTSCTPCPRQSCASLSYSH